jgi:3-oxoacyl-[acyl-carrier protein] reductase
MARRGEGSRVTASARSAAPLAGKHVLVTGGSRGIGRAIVTAMAAAGAAVSFTFRQAAACAEALCAALKDDHATRYLALQCDVSDFAAMRAATAAAAKALGPVDILVNNAGIVHDAPFVMMKEEDWRAVIDVNLHGVFNATKSVAFDLIKRKSGGIVNISSASGVYGNRGQANYSAAKAGLIGLTRSLAKELGPYGIRVNAIAPGFIATDMSRAILNEKGDTLAQQTCLRRVGTPQEVANVAVFLASDAASYVTGQVWEVNGGLSLQ